MLSAAVLSASSVLSAALLSGSSVLSVLSSVPALLRSTEHAPLLSQVTLSVPAGGPPPLPRIELWIVCERCPEDIVSEETRENQKLTSLL